LLSFFFLFTLLVLARIISVRAKKVPSISTGDEQQKAIFFNFLSFLSPDPRSLKRVCG
jgi:hypothetical protein